MKWSLEPGGKLYITQFQNLTPKLSPPSVDIFTWEFVWSDHHRCTRYRLRRGSRGETSVRCLFWTVSLLTTIYIYVFLYRNHYFIALFLICWIAWGNNHLYITRASHLKRELWAWLSHRPARPGTRVCKKRKALVGWLVTRHSTTGTGLQTELATGTTPPNTPPGGHQHFASQKKP